MTIEFLCRCLDAGYFHCFLQQLRRRNHQFLSPFSSAPSQPQSSLSFLGSLSIPLWHFLSIPSLLVLPSYPFLCVLSPCSVCTPYPSLFGLPPLYVSLIPPFLTISFTPYIPWLKLNCSKLSRSPHSVRKCIDNPMRSWWTESAGGEGVQTVGHMAPLLLTSSVWKKHQIFTPYSTPF